MNAEHSLLRRRDGDERKEETLMRYLLPDEEAAIKSSIPWKDIDEKIQNAVRMASEVPGIAPTNSCQGRVDQHQNYYPYISFRASKRWAMWILEGGTTRANISKVLLDFGTGPSVPPAIPGKLYVIVRVRENPLPDRALVRLENLFALMQREAALVNSLVAGDAGSSPAGGS